MTYPVFEPPVRPKTTSSSIEIKTKSNSFGDGYEQSVADGINAVREKLELSWPVLTFDQASQIHEFLKARKGLPFTWAQPGEDAQTWRCVKWTRPFDRGVCSMSAELTEVFA